MSERDNIAKVLARVLCCIDECLSEHSPHIPCQSRARERQAARVLAALDAVRYAVVPVEPTEAMIEAGSYARSANRKVIDNTRDTYRAMIDAAKSEGK
jgi:hypothetical protein